MVLILTYHSLDTSGSVISTPPPRFRRQMERLRDGGFPVLRVSDIVQRLRNQTDLPPNAVAITFDDGYRSTYREAFPILREFGFPATVFLVAGLCGARNQWRGRGESALDLLNWAEVAEMARHGVEFGAHSMTHSDLSGLTADAAREEILQSKQEIEHRVQRPARLFAWPYGRVHAAIQNEVREWFSAVCTTAMNPVTRGCDPAALPRLDMFYFSRNNRFSRFGEPAFARYFFLRTRLRSVGMFLRSAIRS